MTVTLLVYTNRVTRGYLDSSNDKAYLENLVPAVVHRKPPLLEGPNGVTTFTGDRQHKTRAINLHFLVQGSCGVNNCFTLIS